MRKSTKNKEIEKLKNQVKKLKEEKNSFNTLKNHLRGDLQRPKQNKTSTTTSLKKKKQRKTGWTKKHSTY